MRVMCQMTDHRYLHVYRRPLRRLFRRQAVIRCASCDLDIRDPLAAEPKNARDWWTRTERAVSLTCVFAISFMVAWVFLT